MMQMQSSDISVSNCYCLYGCKKVEIITKSETEAQAIKNGHMMVALNSLLKKLKKLIVDQTSSYTLMMTAKNSSKKHVFPSF